MSRALDDLTPAFQPYAMAFIARCIERGVMVMVVDTLRTLEEHAKNLQAGTSKAKLSAHLPRQLRVPNLPAYHPAYGRSDAIDLCPFEIWSASGADKLLWNTADPVWTVVREAAKATGMRWGGDWRDPADPRYLAPVVPKTVDPYDPGHLELPRVLWV